MDWYYLTKVYHIEFCSLPENTSDQFLLMFLRANHFDVPATVNMIKNFRWMLQAHPQYFQNAFDAEKAGRVEEIFERHIQVVPSLRDSKGRRLMIYQVTTGGIALFDICVKSKVSIDFKTKFVVGINSCMAAQS